VGLVFLGIVDFNDGVEDVLFLTFGGLAEDLLGGDLDGGRGAVFDSALVGGHGVWGGVMQMLQLQCLSRLMCM
jgi:hypothetical protein